MQRKKKIKIVFIGNVLMSLSFLKTLKKLKNKVSLQGIISGYKNNLNSDYLSFKNFAKMNGIQFHQTNNINNSTTKVADKFPHILYKFNYSFL